MRVMRVNFSWRYSYNRIDEAFELKTFDVKESKRFRPSSSAAQRALVVSWLISPIRWMNKLVGVNWERAGVAASVKSYSRCVRAQWACFFFLSF